MMVAGARLAKPGEPVGYQDATSAALPQPHQGYSFAEYLALQRDSEIKHEFGR